MSNSPPTNNPISIFRSLTFYGVLFSAIISIGPDVDRILSKGTLTWRDAWAIVQVISASGLVLVMRAYEGELPVYSPKYLPGLNRADFPHTTYKTETEVTHTEGVEISEYKKPDSSDYPPSLEEQRTIDTSVS